MPEFHIHDFIIGVEALRKDVLSHAACLVFCVILLQPISLFQIVNGDKNITVCLLIDKTNTFLKANDVRMLQ